MEDRVYFFEEPNDHADRPLYFQSEEHLKHFREKILIPMFASEGDNPYRLRRPVGVLIYGAPGCGKSFLAKTFALMINKPYIIVSRYDILHSEKLELSNEIDRLFLQAAERSATVIMEDVETIIPTRQSKKGISAQLDVANVLNRIKSCYQKKILIIATTSRPQDVDPQIGYSGYLNELFYTSFPNQEIRCRIIKSCLDERPSGIIDVEYLAKRCEGYTIDDIMDVINTAALNCSLSSCPIMTSNITDAINRKVLLINSSVRKKYDDMHEQLENSRAASKGIGFV